MLSVMHSEPHEWGAWNNGKLMMES